jgi:crotonobetainyl-CoA:carnitine CoA-transferase CaiB-like acyl-CoA transferase
VSWKEKAAMSAPLAGLRVLEIGHFVAAPFCTRILGDLGADIIKVEPPDGDPIRKWGEAIDGNSLWWSVHGRNKRSIVLDIHRPKARDIVLELITHCDVFVENFRPGKLASMGLGPDILRAKRPDLIIAQISGFGQDGPYRDRAAFGVIGEAVGGLRYLTNQPHGAVDLPPVRVGVSIGDSIAGLYASFGILAALWQRDRNGGDGQARTVDVALTESILSMMEGMLPEFSVLGKIKQPMGGAIATAAPSNAYPTLDEKWIIIAANSEPLFGRLAALIKRPDLLSDPRFIDNPARVANAKELDKIIETWTRALSAAELQVMLEGADVPCTQVYTAADCAGDPQYRYRKMVREVDDPLLGRVLHPGIVPYIKESPGQVYWTGAPIGHHTREVLGELLKIDSCVIDELYQEGVIG